MVGRTSSISKIFVSIKVNVPVWANPRQNVGRGVPDVAAIEDSKAGVVIVRKDGQKLEPIDGTSSSVPPWPLDRKDEPRADRAWLDRT